MVLKVVKKDKQQKQYAPAKNIYALNVHLENTVRAFLSGFKSKVTKPWEEKHIIHMQSIGDHAAVYVAEYNAMLCTLSLSSDVRSACALQGVKAQDILNTLLKLRSTDDLTGKQYPAITVDYNPPSGKYPFSPAVTTLEAVYTACRIVLKQKVMREYAELSKSNSKSKTKSK